MSNDEYQGAAADATTLHVKSGQLEDGAQAEQRPPSRLLIWAAFGAVYVIWGSTYLAIKYAIETLPPFLMAGTRFLIAGAALYALAKLGVGNAGRPTERTLASHWRAAAVIGMLLFLCGNGGVTWAEGYITSSLAALLVASEPLWIVLLSWLLPGGSRPNGKVWLGLALGFAGVWLLVSAGTTAAAGVDGGGTNILGAGVVLAASFAWAIGSVYSLRASLPRSPLLSSGMQMLAGGSLMLLVGVMTGELARLDFNSVSARSLFAFLYLTVLGSVVAFTAYSWLLRNASPARVSTYAYVNPAVAVLLGWALAGEAMTAGSLVAAGIIVASVALITSRGKSAGEKVEEAAIEENGVCTAKEAVNLS
jgi:drug/metabolite transporter (DMT)-like permease